MGHGLKYGVAAAGTLFMLTILSWSQEAPPGQKPGASSGGAVLDGSIGAPAPRSAQAQPASNPGSSNGTPITTGPAQPAGSTADSARQAVTQAISLAALAEPLVNNTAAADPHAGEAEHVGDSPAITGATGATAPTTTPATAATPAQPAPTAATPAATTEPGTTATEEIGCETTTPDRSRWIKHQVNRGENLYAIARKYFGKGERWKVVLDANKDRLSSPSKLRAGMTLLIPTTVSGVPVSAPEATTTTRKATDRSASPRLSPGDAGDHEGARSYVVQSGDTLSKIAASQLGSRGKWRRIYEANRSVLRSPNHLRAGQTLTIPN